MGVINTENTPKKRGRPKKTGRPTSYDPIYCEKIIECLSRGHSITGFAGQIGVARSTVFKWAEEHPEFSDAKSAAQAKAVEFWERILAKVASEGGGNATAAIFGLKNRAPDDWADKVLTEVTGKNGGAIETKDMTERSDLEIARRLAFILEKGARAQEK